MSRPLDTNIKKHLYHFITALLLTFGMALCVSGAIFPKNAAGPVFLWSALFCLLFESNSFLKGKAHLALPLAALLTLSGLGALGIGPGHTLLQLGRAVYLSLRGMPEAVLPYADAARIALCVFFAAVGSLIAWDASFPLSCFFVVTLAGLSLVLSGSEKTLLYALPAFAGLVMVLGGRDEKRLSAVVIAMAAVAAAFALLPEAPKAEPRLAKAAADIRQFIEDYLFFTDYRASFTLASEGYQPLEDRLGGPADPKEHPVMQVQTDNTLLLRGKTYDTYSGLNWYDTLSARRYLYASPRYEALKTEKFALNKPLANTDAFGEKTVSVRMLSGGTTTLFAPAYTRRLQMDSERMVLYFNTAAELFLTRNLEENDAYRLSYLSIDPDSEKTREAVKACETLPDPAYAAAQDAYLTLPAHIQQEIFDIARQAAGSAETPYEKALRIRDYLRAHYRYTLDAKAPPDQVDFAAWFLLGEKEGYCTSFATAMTVLCRIAGIPARYVTGYLAVPGADGTAEVRGKDAHAWTEIYLSGMGWLPLDATPRGDNAHENEEGGGSSQTPPSPTPSPTKAPDEAPAATPTPAPTQAPTDEPTEQPKDQPTSQPTQAPEDEKETEHGGRKGGFPWLMLLLLAAAALITLRFLMTEPLRRAARKADQAPYILMRAILGLLALRRISRRPGETLQAFALRADQALADQDLPALTPLMDALSALLYGRHQADPAVFREAYLQYRRKASLPGRIKRAMLRMLRRA